MFLNKSERAFCAALLFYVFSCNAMYNSTLMKTQLPSIFNSPFENLPHQLDTLEAFSDYENQYISFFNQLDDTPQDNQPSVRKHYYDLYCKNKQDYIFKLYFDLAKKYKYLEKVQMEKSYKNAKTDCDLVSRKEQFFKFVNNDFVKGALLCTGGVLCLVHCHYLVTHPR